MSTSRVRVVLGPPGTGKTTFIMGEIDRLLQAGVDPSEIGFYSFTTAACMVARERAADRFNLDPDGPELTNFRTIHSQAYRLIGRDSGAVMKDKHWKEFGEWAHCQFTDADGMSSSDPFLFPTLRSDGDRLRHIYNLARLCRCSIGCAMMKSGNMADELSPAQVERYAQ